MIDVARGVGIFLVLYGHALEIGFFARPDHFFSAVDFAEWHFIYGFHMPLFYFLSGMTTPVDKAEAPERTLGRFLHLMALALAVHLVGSLIVIGLDLEAGRVDVEAWRHMMLGPLKRGYFFNTVVVWFLVSLAFVQVIVRIGFRLGRPFLMALAAIGLSEVVRLLGWPNYWQVESWGPGAVFLVLGTRFRTLRTGRPLMAIGFLLLSVATTPLNHGCVLSAVDTCPNPDLTGRFTVVVATGAIGFPPAFLITATFGVLAVWFASHGLARTPLAPGLAWMGRASLRLMIVNGFLLQFLHPRLAALAYPGEFAFQMEVLALVALHLPLLALLAPAIARLDALSVALADGAARGAVRTVGKLIPDGGR